MATRKKTVRSRLIRELGKDAIGKFVAIDQRTRKLYLGDTTLDAVEAGLRANPRGQFRIERVGYAYAVAIRRTRR